MKNKNLFISIGLFTIALFFNFNVLFTDFSKNCNLKNIVSITMANEEDVDGGYASKQVNYGSGDDIATINGVKYKRTCQYKQTICFGSGDKPCTPGLVLYDCTPFQQI